MEIEVARAHYRPKQITTLFVGESATLQWCLLHYGNSAMTRHMQRAVELVSVQAAISSKASKHMAGIWTISY